MKRQTRPFAVEVKQKRSYQKRSRSIWGDLDLSAAMAETTREIEETQPDTQLIDSDVEGQDAEQLHETQAEHLMAAPQETRPAEVATEPATSVLTPEAKKKTRQPRKAAAGVRAAAAKNRGAAETRAEKAPATTLRTGRKVYSDKERVQKLAQIEEAIKTGGTLKSATKGAGISEQTYYHWKKAQEPASGGDDLKDLIALEEENKRLKGLLAERLRKENAELRKKLGLK